MSTETFCSKNCHFECWLLDQGKSLQQCGQKIKDNYPSTFLFGNAFWPAANLVNFRFIAPHQRILYVSCAGLVWNTFIR